MVKTAGHLNLNLTCLGTGRPTPTVTWYRDGLELGSELGSRYTVEGDDLGRTTDLRIRSVLIFSGRGRDGGGLEPRDSGEYTCQYDNSVGRAQSAVAVKVEHKPFLSEMQQKVAADPGGVAKLACRVRAFPAPEFHWMRAGVSLNSASLASRQVKQVSDYEYESVFTLQDVAQGTYGDYLCRASNNYGSCETMVAVVPRGRPDTPGAPRTLEVGANRLLLAWERNFDGGMNDTVYGLQWEELGGAPGSGGARECKDTICELQGLQQHTTYRLASVVKLLSFYNIFILRVRVRASNRHGKSQWTEALPFTTQIDVSQVPLLDTQTVVLLPYSSRFPEPSLFTMKS